MPDDNLPAPAPQTPPPPVSSTLDDLERMAKIISSSGLYSLTHPQAFTLMLLAQSRGMHPVQAFEKFHVIKGRPSMRADAMLAEFQAQRGTVEWTVNTDTEVEGIFRHPVQAPKGNVSRFTIADAQRAGLPTTNPNWIKYPQNMLRARVTANGIRMTCPGIVTGVYTPEEINDFEPPPPPKQAEARVVEEPRTPPPARANGRGRAAASPAALTHAAPPVGDYAAPIDASPAEAFDPTPPAERISPVTAARLVELMERAGLTDYQRNAALTKRGVDRVEDLDEVSATEMVNKLEKKLDAATGVDELVGRIKGAGKQEEKPAAPAPAKAPRERQPGDDDEPFDDATGKVIPADKAGDDAHEQQEIDAEFDRPLNHAAPAAAG